MKVVIVSGISGIDKNKFIRKLIEYAKITDVSEVIKFEDKMVDPERGNDAPTNIITFLDQPSLSNKINTIEATFEWIQKTKFDPNKKYIFLDVHLIYYKNSEYFPPLNSSNYSGWLSGIYSNAEILIINLIDDVFNIWKSISSKIEDYPHTQLTLREILGWRSLEALQSESLTNILNSEQEGERRVRTYMVSVRHPPSTFKNLLLPKTPICIYLSYPISKTRLKKHMIEKINKFRSKMHDLGKTHGVAIFDPVSIDELYPDLNNASSETVTIENSMRWPLGYQSLAKNAPQRIEIHSREIKDSIPQIKHQIKSRDLRLVESSRVLVVFRPYFGGVSAGVTSEINHAIYMGTTVIIYSPPEDGSQSSGNPFDNNVDMIDDEEKYYEKVIKEMKRLKPI